jgi:hypothetical protein
MACHPLAYRDRSPPQGYLMIVEALLAIYDQVALAGAFLKAGSGGFGMVWPFGRCENRVCMQVFALQVLALENT